jgi:hypothetical protein
MGLCKRKLYPTTGRLVNGNSSMVCKKFEDRKKVGANKGRGGTSMITKQGCIYQDESQRRLNDMAMQ